MPRRTAVHADLDRGDGSRTGPGDAEQAIGADAEDRAALRADNFGLHGHRSDGDLFQASRRSPPLDGVFHRLEITCEGAVEHFDPSQPFHRGYAVPAGDKQPQWKTVHGFQRLAVHLKDQQRVAIEGFFQGQTAGKVHRLGMVGLGPFVGPLEQDLDGAGFDLGSFQELADGDAGPLAMSDRAGPPGDAGDRGPQERAAVAGTFHGGEDAAFRQRDAVRPTSIPWGARRNPRRATSTSKGRSEESRNDCGQKTACSGVTQVQILSSGVSLFSGSAVTTLRSSVIAAFLRGSGVGEPGLLTQRVVGILWATRHNQRSLTEL